MTALTTPRHYLPGDRIVFRYGNVSMEGRVDSVRPGGASLSVWVRLNGSRHLVDVSEHQVLGVLS